jgi:indolepyruvate ferredoxin oxidoreductase
VIDPQRVQASLVTGKAKADAKTVELQPGSAHDLLADRRSRLVAYQNEALANIYSQTLKPLETAPEGVLRQAATQYFRLLAHKDEFEVARLYTDPSFLQGVNLAFDGDMKINFHLGGGPFGKKDAVTGQPVKTRFGPWMMTAFKLLASLRGLRGGVFDPFRNSPERQLAVKLRALYEQDLEFARDLVAGGRAQAAQQLLDWPRTVRGFGHVRERNAQAAMAQRETLLASLSVPPEAATLTPATVPA